MKAILLILTVVANAPAQQFDLICVSKYHDATFHYRVDLAAGSYCVTQDQGKRLTSIGRDCFRDRLYAGSNAISFGVDPQQYVDRVTGKWALKPIGDRYTMYRGTCTAAPFSGFPEVQTKF